MTGFRRDAAFRDRLPRIEPLYRKAQADPLEQAVSSIMGSGILPATLELMDGTTINVVEDFLHAGLPRQAEALLLLEQDGADERVARGDVARMADICPREMGCLYATIASVSSAGPESRACGPPSTKRST